MVIGLINGRAIMPRGESEILPFGVKIDVANDSHIIPMSQIKSIFIGKDIDSELRVYAQLTNVSKISITQPLGDICRKTSADLIKEMYSNRSI